MYFLFWLLITMSLVFFLLLVMFFSGQEFVMTEMKTTWTQTPKDHAPFWLKQTL